MKTIVCLITILIMGLSISGQATPKRMSTPPKISKPTPVKCEMTLDQAPVIRGLKLGMEEKEASAILSGKAEWKYNAEDDTSTAIAMPISLLDGSYLPGFDGVSFVHLASYYTKIYQIQLMYGMKWESINEFVDNFSPKLGVPRAAWQRHVLGAEMPCKGFHIVLMWSPQSSDLQLTNDLVVEQIAETKQKDINAKKKAFKP